MSTCISHHGEYSEHEPNENYVCTLCGALDDDALIADRDAARARLAAVEEVRGMEQRMLSTSVTQLATAKARINRLEAALRDLAKHGTRHDLNPTRSAAFDWLAYIAGMDRSVRERAQLALDGGGQ